MMRTSAGCRACGGRVTLNTRACFQCGQGTPHPSTARALRWGTVGVLTFLVLLVLMHTFGALAQSDPFADWREIDIQRQCKTYATSVPQDAVRAERNCVIAQVKNRDDAKGLWRKTDPAVRKACAGVSTTYPDLMNCLSAR